MKKLIYPIIAAILLLLVLFSLQKVFSNEAKTTIYSTLYTEDAYSSISKGMSMGNVVRVLGPPLLIHTITEEGHRGIVLDQAVSIQEYLNSAKQSKIFPKKNVKNEYWSYSKQKTPTSDYYVRKIVFNNKGNVVNKISETYLD